MNNLVRRINSMSISELSVVTLTASLTVIAGLTAAALISNSRKITKSVGEAAETEREAAQSRLDLNRAVIDNIRSGKVTRMSISIPAEHFNPMD